VSPNPVFLLDANVFIEAAKRYYAFDLAPAFWEALIVHARSDQIRSIDRVKREIDAGDGDLAVWADDNFYDWFESTNQQDIVNAYASVMIWANSQTQYLPGALAEFARNPDGWLVAYALAKGYILVTHETFDPSIRKRVKIPNACRAIGVGYMDTFAMLRQLGVRFD
jgi:hypothetical protein